MAAGDQELSAEDLLRLNQSLKKTIQENEQLLKEKAELEQQVRTVLEQLQTDRNRASAAEQERDALTQKIKAIEQEGVQERNFLEEEKKALEEEKSKHQEELEKTKAAVTAEKTELENKLKILEDQMALEKQWQSEFEGDLSSGHPKGKSDVHQVLSRVNKLSKENERLKSDSGKVHYNLGNIAFQRGEYEKAAAEYRQAVDLIPYEAAAHFNLAFVSGEFLNDPETALKHYQRYLYINPQAEDASLVREKILAARLQLRSTIESPIDEKLGEKKKKKK